MSAKGGILAPAIMLTSGRMQLALGSGGFGKVIDFPRSQPQPDRYDVFVSRHTSSDSDVKYWEEIDLWLKGLRNDNVRIYDHDMVQAGQRIGDEAHVALDEVAIIILLMSQDYRVSPLMERELPSLLKQREGGVLMLTLHLRLFDEYNLEQITGYRRIGAKYGPLDELSPSKRNKVYKELVDVIRRKLTELDRYNH
jgi:hypothetical protein